MSWIRDVSGALHNLDHVQRVLVLPIGNPEPDGDTHAVCVYYPDVEDPETLNAGTEEQCQKMLDAIAVKLPLVRV